jgi:hypothetical protein
MATLSLPAFRFTHHPSFQHRSNVDGTFDSICLRCYRTIDSSPEEHWLAKPESTHICSQQDLQVWMTDRVSFSW